MNSHSRRWPIPVAVALILLAHFALAVASKQQSGTTSDEIAHLTAGLAYWQFDDYRLQPENGNLPQRWAAIPAWISGTSFPKLTDNIYWRTSDVWSVGHQLFYERAEPYRPLLLSGRAMIAVFSTAIGLLIFFWSRHYFGTRGALVSLFFFALCPNFLAHGALVTSDVCLTFFMLACVGAWWWHLHDGRQRLWWLSAVLIGLALVAKFSAVLLIPIYVLTAAVRAFNPEPLRLFGVSFEGKAAKFGAAALSASGQGLVAAGVIWAFYGFRYTAFNPAVPAADNFIMAWPVMLAEIGAWSSPIEILRRFQVLPEAFIYGLAYVINTSAARSAYLDGDYSNVGWVRFFPLAFLYKSTVALLLAVPLGLLAALQAGVTRSALYRATPLAALALVYTLFSLTSNLNIGHRHLLPIYPGLFIAMGLLGAWLWPVRNWRALVVAGLITAQAAAAVGIYPHYLAYFNSLSGGPANGWRHLVDSSLDWGQDLPGLKAWLTANARPQEPVFLSYFGTDEPALYKFNEHRLPHVNLFKIAQPLVPLTPGLYCVSATMLTHVYSAVRGPWTIALEQEYLTAREIEAALVAYTTDPARRTELERSAPAARWRAVIKRYEDLRFARLCYYLRIRAPEAQIGYSIFIYRLSAEEIRAATAGSLRDWQLLIERAARSGT